MYDVLSAIKKSGDRGVNVATAFASIIIVAGKTVLRRAGRPISPISAKCIVAERKKRRQKCQRLRLGEKRYVYRHRREQQHRNIAWRIYNRNEEIKLAGKSYFAVDRGAARRRSRRPWPSVRRRAASIFETHARLLICFLKWRTVKVAPCRWQSYGVARWQRPGMKMYIEASIEEIIERRRETTDISGTAEATVV